MERRKKEKCVRVVTFADDGGKIKNFTGISSSYENPSNPEITIHTGKDNVKNSVKKIIQYLEINGYLTN